MKRFAALCAVLSLTSFASLARAQEMPEAYKQVLDTLGKTGDFKDNVLANEVTPVLKVLRQNGIDIVAIHHHMTGTSPTIYFLHYWGTGSVDKLAAAFKAALDQLGKARASR